LNEFEKYPVLAELIQLLATKEIDWGGVTRWSEFLGLLNGALSAAYDEGYIDGAAEYIRKQIRD
jgi:hypothetical protein